MGKLKNVATSPHQSTVTLLVSVEDLINKAMGPEDKNLVNYKLMQTVLHILARQMRLLDQKVEIRVTEYLTHRDQAEKEEYEPAKKAEKAAKEKEKKDRTAEKERRNIERTIQKEKARESMAVPKERVEAVKSATKGRTNIEVVTRSQFNDLKDKVTDLTDEAGPLPMPSMPQNKELLQRLSKGTASLTDTMAAMQVSARLVAAEQAIGQMGGILTQLALAGALPEDIVGQVEKVTTELEAGMKEVRARAGEAVGQGQGPDVLSLGVAGGSEVGEVTTELEEAAGQGLGPDVLSLGVAGGREPSKVGGVSLSRKSIISSKSKASTLGAGMEVRGSNAASMVSGLSEKVPKVTHPELEDAIYQLQQDLAKNMGFLVAKSSATADASMAMVKAVADKLEMAMRVNNRISTLHTIVTEYAEQLDGFDAGVTTQMQSFGEQIVQMRGDLGAGLKLLESVNNNAETAAVMELTERYEGLVTELDNTLQSHKELSITQNNLGYDMRDLLNAVEMLREQKADRDEVQDGLRDKADNSRLAGLVTDEEFAESRTELERRLLICHDKFHRQGEVWMGAVRDLRQIVEVKADLVHLMGTREEAQRHLEILHEMCRKLALVLGEPKAAVLTRQLAQGALCAACMVPALMELEDAARGAPPLLPAARPRPAGAPAQDEPCEEFQLIVPTDERRHMCNRWVGGSHTQISGGAVSQLHAEPMTYDAPPTKRYAGYGQDGRLYMMEEELKPCLECNRMSDETE